MFNRLYIILFCFVVTNAVGQEKLNYFFEHLNSLNGFPAKNVRSIKKDKEGFLWMCTEKGLMRYNGHSGKFYGVKKDSSGVLPAPMLTLHIDKVGLIWIGYLDGYISCFNPKTEKFTHYYHSNEDKSSFPYGAAMRFREDEKGNFWIPVWGGGLTYLNRQTGKFKNYLPDKNNPYAISTINITEIARKKDGTFLIGCWDGDNYLNKFQTFDPVTEKFINFPLNDYAYESAEERIRISAAFGIIHFIHIDEKEDFWIGTYVGLVHVDNKSKTIKRYTGSKRQDGLIFGLGNYENASNYAIDNQGKMWIGTEVTGIMIVDMKTKHCSYLNRDLNNTNGIGADNITDLFKDVDGNIWVSGGGSGIDIYSSILQQFKTISNEKLKAERANRAQGQSAITYYVLSENSDKIYFCNGNGLSIYYPEKDSVERIDTKEIILKLEHLKPTDLVSNPSVINFVTELQDKLFIGTGMGFLKYDLKTKVASEIKNKEFIYYLIFKSKNNKELYATIGKIGKEKKADLDSNFYLVKLNPVTLTIEEEHVFPKFPFANDHYFNYVFNGQIDNENWYIEYNKFLFYVYNSKSKTFKAYSARKGLENFPDSMLRTLTIDNENNVWLNGLNGLYKFNCRTEKSERFNEILGIGKEPVLSITIDKDNIFWVALRQDLVRYNPKTGDTFRFSNKLGLNAGGFPWIITMQNKSNEVFIPTIYGVLKFRPEELNFSKRVPGLFISQIIINKDTINEVERSRFISQVTELKSNQNFLTFEFASDQVYAPGRKRYEFRLLGLDTAWYQNQNRNYINYTNLASGNYTLEVRCKNDYDILSKTLHLPFTILKPIWLRWWFISMVIIFLIISIRFYIKFREKKLNANNEKLEHLVNDRTKEVTEKSKQIESQNELIQEKNKELTDSIKYAERIQKTLLAHKDFMEENLPDHFVFFTPKDIVSGDFYWAAEHNGKFYLAICDSTGHGVPGAFMSLLNISFLNEAVSEKRIVQPNLVLNHVRSKLIEGLSQEGGRDGMDGTLICYDKKNNVLQYASAHNKPILVRNNTIKDLPADKMPIGKGEKEDSFNLNTIELIKGDTLYFYTDGFADQFGGPKGKKFKYRQLNELLLSISSNSLSEQKEILQNNFNTWKGGLEQVDDVLLIGIKF